MTEPRCKHCGEGAKRDVHAYTKHPGRHIFEPEEPHAAWARVTDAKDRARELEAKVIVECERANRLTARCDALIAEVRAWLQGNGSDSDLDAILEKYEAKT
jgi:hypothetical protein